MKGKINFTISLSVRIRFSAVQRFIVSVHKKVPSAFYKRRSPLSGCIFPCQSWGPPVNDDTFLFVLFNFFTHFWPYAHAALINTLYESLPGLSYVTVPVFVLHFTGLEYAYYVTLLRREGYNDGLTPHT